MHESDHLFIFCLESVRHAISLSVVERVIRAVEVTPLPVRTGNIIGVINIHGSIVPVVDTRRMLGLSERPITPDDCFVIVRTGLRLLALVADSVEHVAEIAASQITSMDEIAPDSRHLTGIARMESGIVIIHDLEQCIKESGILYNEHYLEKADRYGEAG